MKKKIVIVEDNTKIREGFAAVIESTDDYILTGHYSNCEDAIKNLAHTRPDLVMMDIELPGINGIEGTAMIKKLIPDCIVLIITVFEDSKKVFDSLCAGACGYIIKNSGSQYILQNIEDAFNGGAPMSLNIARMVVQSFIKPQDSPLSDREQDVLKGIAAGKSYSKIALDLFISKETVRSHIKNIYQKLAVNSKAEALQVAGNRKWIG